MAAWESLWVIAPFQLLIALPGLVEGLADSEVYTPTVILVANIFIFSTVVLQIRDVARRSEARGAAGRPA